MLDKDYFVLNYPAYEYDVETITWIFNYLKKIIPEESSLIALPEMITLKKYSKEELIENLKIYSNYMESLINE